MNRSDLAAIVNPAPLTSLTAMPATLEVANQLREQLTAYFASPDGIRDLADAPRVNGRQITAAEAVEELVAEARGMETE